MSTQTTSSRSSGQCSHIELLLPWFCNETLDADETSQVKAHLIVCSSCRAELKQTREVLDTIAWSEGRDSRLQDRSAALHRSELRSDPSTAPVSAFRGQTAGAMRLAAAALFALGLGYVVGQSQAPTVDVPNHAVVASIASAGVESDGQALMADSFESGTVGNWLVEVGDVVSPSLDSNRARQGS